jgi:hypothetical protein
MDLFLSASLLLLIAGGLDAQEEPDIRALLPLVNRGEEQLLQAKLPQLLEQYPNHPGLLYLKGLVTTDGDEAVGYFQSVVNESPASEWADDALFKVFEYYYAIGAYNVAARQAAELRKNYSSSPWLKKLPASIAAASPAPAKEAAPPLTYSVQAGAFSTAGAAQVRVREVRKLGYSGEMHTKMSGSGAVARKLYAVWVGEFSVFDQAAAFAKKMKQRHNIDAIVVRR